MSKGTFIPEIPYENLVRKICGPQWRGLPEPDIDAAWGVAIVRSALKLGRSDLGDISSHLGIDRDLLYRAHRNLSLNGIFTRNRLNDDRKALENQDSLAWGFYGGYASGATGLVKVENGRRTQTDGAFRRGGKRTPR